MGHFRQFIDIAVASGPQALELSRLSYARVAGFREGERSRISTSRTHTTFVTFEGVRTAEWVTKVYLRGRP